jgi:uncharacterized protein (TIGR00369 family)
VQPACGNFVLCYFAYYEKIMSDTPSNLRTDDDVSFHPPEPFRQSTRRGPFTSHNGPWFHWADGAVFRQGVRLLPRHCNSRGIVHGGFLCSFADGLAATAVYRETGKSSVTMKLNTEFLRSAVSGDWLQGTAHVVRQTKTMAFVEARAWVGEGLDEPVDALVFSASAVFRLRT